MLSTLEQGTKTATSDLQERPVQQNSKNRFMENTPAWAPPIRRIRPSRSELPGVAEDLKK